MAKQLFIDAAMLERRNACQRQVELFRRVFGDDRVLVTVSNIRKAALAGLDVAWPVTSLWWEAPCATKVEDAAYSLRVAAHRSASSPERLIALYRRAAPLWAQIKTGAAA